MDVRGDGSPETVSDLPKATQQTRGIIIYLFTILANIVGQVKSFRKGSFRGGLTCTKVQGRSSMMVMGVGAGADVWGQILALPLAL